MQKEEILKELEKIFSRVLGNDTSLSPEFGPKDIHGWDSMAQIELVVATEKHFKIKVSASEMLHIQKISDFCDLILKKRKV
jgi:acyl carrier protein